MAQSNWRGEDAVANARRNSDRAARQAKAQQLDRREAGHAAGRGRRRV